MSQRRIKQHEGASSAGAVIVDAVRTPIGKRNGSLAGVHPADLSGACAEGLAGVRESNPGLATTWCGVCVGPGRRACQQLRPQWRCFAAGWPVSVPATTVDRQCGSSQQAL
ncbi:hypothetical protein GS531_18205, partial [Rhodococcus hoagii]|nr:hypothetical protein [Prescottella equi]